MSLSRSIIADEFLQNHDLGPQENDVIRCVLKQLVGFLYFSMVRWNEILEGFQLVWDLGRTLARQYSIVKASSSSARTRTRPSSWDDFGCFYLAFQAALGVRWGWAHCEFVCARDKEEDERIAIRWRPKRQRFGV